MQDGRFAIELRVPGRYTFEATLNPRGSDARDKYEQIEVDVPAVEDFELVWPE